MIDVIVTINVPPSFMIGSGNEPAHTEVFRLEFESYVQASDALAEFESADGCVNNEQLVAKCQLFHESDD